MNIENLNPEENNNNNNVNVGASTNSFVAPLEPTFANVNSNPVGDSVSPAPSIEPLNPGANSFASAPLSPGVASPSPAPVSPDPGVTSAPLPVGPNPDVTPVPSPVGPNPSVTPAPSPVGPNPGVTSSSPINLQPEGVASENVVVNPPEPLMGATLTANTPLTNKEALQPVNESNASNNTINTISENPPTFGGVPTPPNTSSVDTLVSEPKKDKRKGKGKKSLIIILVFILILGIGAGVYYFLNVSQTSSIVVTPILNELELGSTLSDNLSDYASFSGIDPASCKLNNSAINVDIINTYSYSISCPGLSEDVKSTVRVRDTVGPVVKLKDVVVKPDTDVLVDDFISKCSDLSLNGDCDVSISDSSIDLDELVKEVGTYEIPLSIKDDFNNETLVTANLVVSDDAPSLFLNCEVASDFKTTTKANVRGSYEYGINDADEISTAKKVLIYQFDSESDYLELKSSYEANQTIDNLIGDVSFDDDNYRAVLEVNLDVEELSVELDSDSEIKTYEDVAVYHETSGDFCSLP